MVSVEMVRDAQVISDSTKREKIVNQNTVIWKKELENLNIRLLSITDVKKEHSENFGVFWGKIDYLLGLVQKIREFGTEK